MQCKKYKKNTKNLIIQINFFYLYNKGKSPLLSREMFFFTSKKKKPKSHWGEHLWGFIHTICVVDHDYKNYQYHQEVIKKLKAIQHVLPCPKCLETYSFFIKRIDYLDLSQPMVLFYWSVDLHNAVNTKLGNPNISNEEALHIWTK